MSYSGPGMYMPKQNTGKHWQVNYSIVLNGKSCPQNRKFRIKSDALDFIRESKVILNMDSRVSAYSFETVKIQKGN